MHTKYGENTGPEVNKQGAERTDIYSIRFVRDDSQAKTDCEMAEAEIPASLRHSRSDSKFGT